MKDRSNRAARVATYRRTAAATAEGCNSLESQAERIQECCQAHGLEVSWDVVDEGRAGTTVGRTGLSQVIALAETGEIGILIASSPDRVTRDNRLLHEFLRRMADAGCVVRFASDSALTQRIVPVEGQEALSPQSMRTRPAPRGRQRD